MATVSSGSPWPIDSTSASDSDSTLHRDPGDDTTESLDSFSSMSLNSEDVPPNPNPNPDSNTQTPLPSLLHLSFNQDHACFAVGTELSGSSPVVNFGACRVTPSDEGLDRRVKREESSRKSYRVEESHHHGVASGDTGSKASGRLGRINDVIAKTLSDQLHEVVVGGDSDDVVSSNVRPRVRYGGGGMSRTKRRKFRGTWRVRGKSIERDITGGGGKSEMSVASNSVPQGDKEGIGEQNMTKSCGILFNWSRIHHRGKTFLDKAGRSLSCGMSDSKEEKVSPMREGMVLRILDCILSSPRPPAYSQTPRPTGMGPQHVPIAMLRIKAERAPRAGGFSLWISKKRALEEAFSLGISKKIALEEPMLRIKTVHIV